MLCFGCETKKKVGGQSAGSLVSEFSTSEQIIRCDLVPALLAGSPCVRPGTEQNELRAPG
jgi:hypothetical protein